jgi:transcriptional regulator with XRE-family HTH domain
MTTTRDTVRRARYDLGLTAHKVANALGVSETVIRKLENGQDAMTDEWLARFASVYGVSIDRLRGDADDDAQDAIERQAWQADYEQWVAKWRGI